LTSSSITENTQIIYDYQSVPKTVFQGSRALELCILPMARAGVQIKNQEPELS